LGDVLQSGIYHNGRVWLVLNNSGKITPVDNSGKAIKGEIKNLKSPRYILPVNGDTAWVTDLFDNHIYRVNLASSVVIDKIACPGWNEEIISAGNHILVANNKGRVYFFSKDGSLTDSIVVKSGCHWLQLDKAGYAWSLSSDSGKSELNRIDVNSKKTINTIAFNGSSSRLKMNIAKDSLYLLNNGLYAISINASSMPALPLFVENGITEYGLAVDPYTGLIYLSNAKDYVSRGEIIVLLQNGVVKNRFNSGISPTDFLFFL
jgi:hypothetical protein